MGGFAQHSRAIPPAWGSESGPRGLAHLALGSGRLVLLPPGGSPQCPSGLPGKGAEGSTTPPTLLNSLIYT